MRNWFLFFKKKIWLTITLSRRRHRFVEHERHGIPIFQRKIIFIYEDITSSDGSLYPTRRVQRNQNKRRSWLGYRTDVIKLWIDWHFYLLARARTWRYIVWCLIEMRRMSIEMQTHAHTYSILMQTKSSAGAFIARAIHSNHTSIYQNSID